MKEKMHPFGKLGDPHKRVMAILLAIFLIFNMPQACAQEKMDQAPSEATVKELVSRIKKDTDPAFVYDYDQTKFVPPHGKTLLIMGQTVESITEYMDHFPDRPVPGGWSAYWGIPQFTGVTESVSNETGSSQNHQMLVDRFPNTTIQSALWMAGMWDVAKNAGKGEYDEVVKKYSAWAKSVNRPIYLRIGYEFDGPHNQLEPEEYVKAYKRIVDLMRTEGADNVAFVWHSYASPPFKDYPLSAWYPGDDYVDWVAISVFGHAYGSDFGPYCDKVLAFAREHKKPVMIAESNPVYGIEKENLEAWEWFVNFFSFIHNKNIKAVSFINEDWTRLNIPGISEWKDGRLQNNPLISEAWFHETNKDRYLKQDPDLFSQLGFHQNP